MSIFDVPKQQYAPVSFLFSAAQIGVGALAPPDRVMLDEVTVDATLEEEHIVEVDVTEHPVEKGASITDHIRPKLRELRIFGIISNTSVGLTGPIGDALAVGALATGVTVPGGAAVQAVDLMKNGALFQRVKATFDKLQKLVDNAVPITIHTPLRDYPNMAIHNLRIVRRTGLGDAIEFTMACREVRTVDSLTVLSPAPIQAPKSLGTQGTSSTPSITTEARSALKSATDATHVTAPGSGVPYRPKGK